MRIYIRTTPNNKPLPFNYQTKMVGTIHKWLGANDIHGKTALFSYSWLYNAKASEGELNFPEGAKFFISFYDERYMNKIIRTILQDPDMFFGLKVEDIRIQENPDFSNQILFNCASPIFLKDVKDEIGKHYTFADKESGRLLTEKLAYKMELAGLQKDENLKIEFAVSQCTPKIKLIDYRGIKNRASQCAVTIEAKPETKLFAWNVGLGNSTGIGFGAIY